MDLARIIASAKPQTRPEATKEAFSQLQKLQFKKWMSKANMDPSVVERMLSQKSDVTSNLRVYLDVYDFCKANGESPFYYVHSK